MAEIKPVKRAETRQENNRSPVATVTSGNVAPAPPFAIAQPVAPPDYPPTVLEDLLDSVSRPLQPISQEERDEYLGYGDQGPRISRVYSQDPTTGEVELKRFQERVDEIERYCELIRQIIMPTTEDNEEESSEGGDENNEVGEDDGGSERESEGVGDVIDLTGDDEVGLMLIVSDEEEEEVVF